MYQQTFHRLHKRKTKECIQHKTIFFCDIYNVPEIIDVDAARLKLFINTHMVSDIN